MKIALAQQNYHIGNFELNTKKILDGIDRALTAGAELVVFSELCVCGYPPRDFLEFNDFIAKCDEAIEAIKQKTGKIGVIVGCPVRNSRKEGKDLFNAGMLLYKKEISGTAYKTLLPTYDVFDEYRYFEPSYTWNVIEFGGKKIALTVCEDLWNLSDNPLYRSTPMEQLIRQKPDLMINISASPFDYDHDDDRKEVLRANVQRYKLPLIYCNTVGSQTEIVFDGGSLVFDAKGNIMHEMKYFEEDFVMIDTNISSAEVVQNSKITLEDLQHLDKEMRVAKVKDPEKIIDYLTDENNIKQIYKALVLGIKDYFGKMGFSKAIIGSSGGVDSAVTLALACKALGNENVRAILMPSQYSSGHSVSDAEQLSKNLQNPYDIIAIKDIYDSFLKELSPLFKDMPFGVAEENIQSRTRGNLLMAIANKFGYILLNTSNKSELATGYGTLYGDMAGGLGVLGDVYKMQVFALAKYINRDKEIIPQHIIVKPPSAELRPNQKDTDSLPDYAILDKILFQYIEKRQGPKELIAMGFDPAVVARILKLVNTNEYKRNQFCPIIRVSSKAFGVGRRMPIVGKYLS
ncbi:MAG: NAD+ synthase [Chitinophagaceae bacterium]|nr:NAD+ synthase [Chitinophagaceae bacterium]